MSVGQVQEEAATIPFPKVKRYRVWGDFLPHTKDPVGELRKDAGGDVVVQATTTEKALLAYYRRLDRATDQTQWKAVVLPPGEQLCQVWEAEFIVENDMRETIELKLLRSEPVDLPELTGEPDAKEIDASETAEESSVASEPAVAAPTPPPPVDPIPDRPPLVLPPAKVEPSGDAMREFFERVSALRLAERMAEQDVALASNRLKAAKANHLTASEALGRLLDEGPERLPLLDRKPPQAAPAKAPEAAEDASSNTGPTVVVWDEKNQVFDLAPRPAGPPDESWRDVPVHELAIPKAVADRLAEHDCGTLGALEELRGGKGLRSIKGIGQAKADAIEEAVLAWLSKNRDGAALKAVSLAACTIDATEDDDGDTD